jgi:hypothetical protein
MEKQTENTFRRIEGATSPPTTLAELAWLVGHWSGPAFGGTCEEIWSPPAGGAMMGMFRLVAEEKTVFYEFLTITQEHDTLSLQLKHFNPDLVGWEEKDKKVTFPLVAVERERVHFEGMSFHRESADEITIFLAIRSNDGTLHEEKFAYTRISS